jgi:adenylate cyclase
MSLCGASAALLLALSWLGFAPLRQAESAAEDWRLRLGRKPPADGRLVLIGIDRPSYADNLLDDEVRGDPALAALRGNWPWPRSVWAVVTEKLLAAGARVVAIDLLFAGPGNGDEEFARVLEKFPDHLVLGANFTVAETERGTLASLQVPTPTLLKSADGRPAALDPRVGYINVWADDDGVLRRAHFHQSNQQAGHVLDAPPDARLESLAARVLRQSGRPERIPPSPDPVRFRFAAPPGGAWPVIPVLDMLLPRTWERNFGGGAFFRDKLVLIGPTAPIFQDRHRTPFAAEMAGPEVHVNVINAALHGAFLRDASAPVRLLVIGVGGLLAMLCFACPRVWQRFAGLALANAGGVFAAQLAFDRANLVVPLVAPLLALNLGAALVLVADLVHERLERMKLRHTMALYFSPRVLDAVLSDPGSMEPRRAEVTLLLTDLRNSTPLAEALGPKGMFELLNRVFEAQTEAIMSEEGNLEHFLGDQFLSYWGAPQKQPDAADRAERAARKLIRAMEDLRATLPPEVAKLFGYGVALHSGPVLVGNKGSARRLDYGLVGDTVNEAARVEALTKLYGVTLLVTRDTFAQFTTQGARRLVDRVIVKGKTEPVELFEAEHPLSPPNYAELCHRYKEANHQYVFGQFAGARALFEQLAAEFHDGPSRRLAERCAHLAANPPAEWKGVWKLAEK